MSKLSAFENLNKRLGGLPPSPTIQPYSPSPPSPLISTNNPALRGSRTILRRSQVISNIPGGTTVQYTVEQQISQTPIGTRGPTIPSRPIVETVSRTEYVQDQGAQQWKNPGPVVVQPSPVSRIRRGYVREEGRGSGGRWGKYCNWTCCCWAVLIAVLLGALGFGLMKAFGSMFGEHRHPGIQTGKIQAKGQQGIANGSINTSGNQGAEYEQAITSKGKQSGSTLIEGQQPAPRNFQQVCSPGFFRYNGQCIKCPPGSVWNRTNCVTRRVVESSDTTETSQYKTQADNLQKLAEQAWNSGIRQANNTTSNALPNTTSQQPSQPLLRQQPPPRTLPQASWPTPSEAPPSNFPTPSPTTPPTHSHLKPHN